MGSPITAAEQTREHVSCEFCKQSFELVKYNQFDLGMRPEWKKILMDRGFFGVSCPHCGRYVEALYPCRLLDPEGKLSVVVRPGIEGARETVLGEMNARLEGLGAEGWKRRAVGNFYAVQEQLRAREAGLDDRALQLLKPFIIGQLQSMGRVVWNGFFISREEGLPDAERREGVIYMSMGEDGEDAHSQSIYWYDIYLTDLTVLRQGINETAFEICTRLLRDAGYEEDDGCFYAYDLEWAIGFHNSRNE